MNSAGYGECQKRRVDGDGGRAEATGKSGQCDESGGCGDGRIGGEWVGLDNVKSVEAVGMVEGVVQAAESAEMMERVESMERVENVKMWRCWRLKGEVK